MTFAPMLKVQWHFLDHNGNVAQLSCYVPIAIDSASLQTFINDYGAILEGLTDAKIVKARVFIQYAVDSDETAAIDSDINSRVLLFYRNENGCEKIDIPSPEPGLFETEGPFAGIRVLSTSDEMVAWFADQANLLEHICTKEGEAFPETYVVGGKML